MSPATAVKVMLLLPLCGGVPGFAQTWSANVGVYHWGGQPRRTVSQGVKEIAGWGGKIVRITLSPTYYKDYGTGNGCYANYSLTAIAQDPDVKGALEDPHIEVFMITAYDGTSFGDCAHQNYLNPSFYTASNNAAVIQEYSDFTFYLYQTYGHSGKRFIISNWESDNDVYCGDAYAYATNQSARSTCDASYPTLYNGNTSPAQSLEGLRMWFAAREQGIIGGRNRAAAQGLSGMRVLFAPEFSIVRALHDAGLESVLYDVLPDITFDYVSYSAYESINQPEPDSALTADLNIIQEVVGSNLIILGEVGFSAATWGQETAISRTDKVVPAALSWGVPFIFMWNLYDQGRQNTFGLVDANGRLTPLGLYYLRQIAGPEPLQLITE